MARTEVRPVLYPDGLTVAPLPARDSNRYPLRLSEVAGRPVSPSIPHLTPPTSHISYKGSGKHVGLSSLRQQNYR